MNRNIDKNFPQRVENLITGEKIVGISATCVRVCEIHFLSDNVMKKCLSRCRTGKISTRDRRFLKYYVLMIDSTTIPSHYDFRECRTDLIFVNFFNEICRHR